jgi:hypothetical protein
MIQAERPRVVLVDLNNFARHPTLAVGLLAAILRRDGFTVDVLSPLAHGVQGVPHRDTLARSRDHRRAVSRVLAACHRINRRRLDGPAEGFEGAM